MPQLQALISEELELFTESNAFLIFFYFIVDVAVLFFCDNEVIAHFVHDEHERFEKLSLLLGFKLFVEIAQVVHLL